MELGRPVKRKSGRGVCGSKQEVTENMFFEDSGGGQAA